VLLPLLHRDQQVWADPERFDPDRFATGQAKTRSPRTPPSHSGRVNEPVSDANSPCTKPYWRSHSYCTATASRRTTATSWTSPNRSPSNRKASNSSQIDDAHTRHVAPKLTPHNRHHTRPDAFREPRRTGIAHVRNTCTPPVIAARSRSMRANSFQGFRQCGTLGLDLVTRSHGSQCPSRAPTAAHPPSRNVEILPERLTHTRNPIHPYRARRNSLRQTPRVLAPCQLASTETNRTHMKQARQ
jgi:hypothetical protein